ncbi:MAG: aminotransferase class IV [Gemmatimonadota bacterium]
MDIVFLNGEYLRRAEARVSVDDRGFLFGDGVYEFTPAYHGRFFRASRHRARMRASLGQIAIDYDLEEWDEIHGELLARNDLSGEPAAAVYFQVTRGEAPRAHVFPPSGTRPTLFAFAQRFERADRAAWEEGFTAVTEPDTRWGRVDIKTLQLLPNVLALESARSRGVSEAILVRDSVALEGSHNNLFAVFGRTVRTHPLSNRILAGITREVVLEIARGIGYEVEEAPIGVDSLESASEIFLTGSSTEIRPIVELDDRRVGAGVAGPVTRAVYDGFLDRVREECGHGLSGARATDI